MKTNFHSLNSTYNFCALKNLQFRFQEKNLNLNRDSDLGSPDHYPDALTNWAIQVSTPVSNVPLETINAKRFHWNGNLDSSIGKNARLWSGDMRFESRFRFRFFSWNLRWNLFHTKLRYHSFHFSYESDWRH